LAFLTQLIKCNDYFVNHQIAAVEEAVTVYSNYGIEENEQEFPDIHINRFIEDHGVQYLDNTQHIVSPYVYLVKGQSQNIRNM
jgi:UTP-glucose-1-phosphate uridylyltransferase